MYIIKLSPMKSIEISVHIFFCIYLAGYPVGTVGKGESWLELLDVYLAPARPPRPPGFSKSSSSFTIAA